MAKKSVIKNCGNGYGINSLDTELKFIMIYAIKEKNSGINTLPCLNILNINLGFCDIQST